MKYLLVLCIITLQTYAYNYGNYKENLKACNNGNAKRCNDLAGIYLRGEGSIRGNKQKAQYYYDMSMKLYKKYCKSGDGKACYDLAKKYNGMRWHIDQDLGMMAKYHEKACNLGYGKGCNELGAAYKRGWGVPKDKEKSNQYYQKALVLYEKECLEGIGESCNWLGTIYDVGLYTNRDKTKAEEYFIDAFDIFKDACQNNDAEGCYQVAQQYLTGQGVERDYEKAKVAFEKSCKLGESSACHEAKNVEHRKEIDAQLAARIEAMMSSGKYQ